MVGDGRDTWKTRAACKPSQGFTNAERAAWTALWFPARGELSPVADAICGSCPVQVECEDFGQKERFGIWGQVRAGQRRRARSIARQERISLSPPLDRL